MDNCGYAWFLQIQISQFHDIWVLYHYIWVLGCWFLIVVALTDGHFFRLFSGGLALCCTCCNHLASVALNGAWKLKSYTKASRNDTSKNHHQTADFFCTFSPCASPLAPFWLHSPVPVIVTPAVCPRLLEFHHFDIQSILCHVLIWHFKDVISRSNDFTKFLSPVFSL